MTPPVVEFPQGQKSVSGGGGSGEFDQRLRDVEGHLRELREGMKHVALREDVLKLRIWVLGGVIGGMIAAVTLGIAIARLFMMVPAQ